MSEHGLNAIPAGYFAEAWPGGEFVQAMLAQLPWLHQLALLDKLQTAAVQTRVGCFREQL
jgi:hypothetical protein